MLNYKEYNLIYNDDYCHIIGYKKEVVRYLKDNLKAYIDGNYTRDVLEEELERLSIVNESKYENEDLIILENNDEERSHIPSKPIARVKVLIPYGNGFAGSDVLKYF